MSKNVIIIGGGIIGLCSAYYLLKQEFKITIVDQSNMNAGASYVNAGYLSPSHIVPLSAPGVMKKGLKWMFDPTSPLYIKPRLNGDFLRWVWAFNRSCNSNHVKKAIPIIKDISVLSQELYDEIKATEKFKFHYEKKGLLMLCQTEKALKEEIEVAKLAGEVGLDVEELTSNDLKKLEPNATINALGATYYKCDSHTTPNEFMEDMKTYLQSKEVTFLTNEKVEDFMFHKTEITALKTDKQVLKADEFILTAGSWSSILAQKLGIKLLLQAGKGYRINSKKHNGITIPAILAEAKVAITPMNGFTRFAGTMEIAGVNHKINETRVEAIATSANKYYPNVNLTKEEKENAACGLRPVSPDGLPYIGKSVKCKNLTIATGHAMMGWSMATATGKLVSEIISEEKLSLVITHFHPDRRF